VTPRRLARAAALGLALGLWAAPAPAADVRALFPHDGLTRADPTQLTGRRIALPLPDCSTEPSSCDEIRLLNALDGFSVNPRLAVKFSGPIEVDSVSRAGAFILPLSAEPLPSPVGLAQLVWDPDTDTLYARPERGLLQGRRYALVLTARLRDAAGRPIRRAPGLPRLREAADAPSAAAELWRRLEAMGMERREVVAATVFTTQSVTADLEKMRAVIDARPAPTLRFELGPGGTRSVYRRAEIEAVELRRQVATGGEGRLADPVRLPLGLIPPAEVGLVALGRFASLSFLMADRHIPAVPTRSGAIRPQGEEEVHVTVFLPAGPMPPEGWPTAIFGHGFGNDRHLVPPLVAGTMARQGFATVAINVVGHGGGPAGTLTVRQPGREPVMLPAGGRGLDLDGDGRIGSTEGVSTLNTGPLAVVGSRDGLKQTTADLMQLVRAIRRGVDLDGDGRPDLDRERIFYFGQSFGGIYGTLLMTVDPLIWAGVLNVPGGPIVEIARQAAPFRPRVIEQLKVRRPSLMNGERDFDESLPLPGDPPVLRPARGALAIQAFFDRAEWVSQSANPVAFAPYLRQAPLAGLGPRQVLYQMALGDRTVPNPTTASLIRAGRLEPVLSVYRHDRVAPGLPERFANPHGFLVWTAFPETAALARAAQEQVARFFLSGGRDIARTHEAFAVPPPPR
jgi:dienelactone hydrolase